jgi:hypothetical protein
MMMLHRVLPSPVRLALARTLAWALLFGGWLVLGEAGQRQLPLWAGGLVPLALWLAGLGVLLGLLQGRRVSIRHLRTVLLAAGSVLACIGLMPGRSAPVLLAALAWSLLLVAASLSVQALRRATPSRPPAPLVPATAGALLAWSLVSLPGASAWPGVAIAAAALALALLVPRSAAPVPACRGGLFDCSLPWPDPARWRRVADWPRQAALLAMLPMMATLPAMADWCRSDWGLSPASSTLWHLAAMLLPALLLRRWLARAGEQARGVAVTLLMVASGGAMWAYPGLAGLMVVTLLQAIAWSLVWAWPMLRPSGAAPIARRSSALGAAMRTLAPAFAVLALGSFTADLGPDALRAAQALLAVLALAGAAVGIITWLLALRPLEKHT